MREGRVVVRVKEGAWADQLLPALGVRAARGAVIVISNKTIKVDRRGEDLYNKDRAREPEGSVPMAPPVS